MKTVEMEVVDIRRVVGEGKLKAFADVKIADSLIMKGFRVFDGSKGLFVSMPSRPGKDGKWVETMTPLSDGIKREIENMVLEAYDCETDGVKN